MHLSKYQSNPISNPRSDTRLDSKSDTLSNPRSNPRSDQKSDLRSDLKSDPRSYVTSQCLAVLPSTSTSWFSSLLRDKMRVIWSYCNICHLTVELALRQGFKLYKARFVQLEYVLEVGLLQAPTEYGAVLPVKHCFLVDLKRQKWRNSFGLATIFNPPSDRTQYRPRHLKLQSYPGREVSISRKLIPRRSPGVGRCHGPLRKRCLWPQGTWRSHSCTHTEAGSLPQLYPEHQTCIFSWYQSNCFAKLN